MSAPRIVHIDTLDHDLVTVRCPQWCNGTEHEAGGYRVDISHTSDDTDFTVDTDRGTVLLLSLSLEQRPFVEGAPGTGVFVNVEINGDWHPHDVAGLDRLAARLVDIAGEVRAQARRLAVLQTKEAQS